MLRKLSLLILLFGILQLPVYRGGNADWPPVILAICTAISLIFAGFAKSTNSYDRPLKLRVPGVSIAMWLAWISWQLIQITPLSHELLSNIAPYSLAFHDAVSAAGGQPRYTISVSPAESLDLLLLSLVYFFVYLAVSVHAADQSSARFILWTIFLGACAQALYGALHELAAVSHELLDASGRHQHVATGTFANRNHFAAFCTLGFAAGLALMLGRSSAEIEASNWHTRLKQLLETLSSSAVLIRIGLIGIVIGVVLSRSRMGNTALALGISVYALAWLLTTRRKRSFFGAMLLFSSIAIADVLLISDQFGLERVLQRIETTDLDTEGRTAANAMSRKLMLSSGAFGTGLGSYSGITESQRPPGLSRMLHFAHNDYYQFVIEAGHIGMVLLGSLMAYHLLLALKALNSRRTHKRAVAAAILMVITASLLHATVEFNFRIPGYAATLLALIALASVNSSQPKKEQP